MSATSKFRPEGAHFHSIMLSRPFLVPRGTLVLLSIGPPAPPWTRFFLLRHLLLLPFVRGQSRLPIPKKQPPVIVSVCKIVQSPFLDA